MRTISKTEGPTFATSDARPILKSLVNRKSVSFCRISCEKTPKTKQNNKTIQSIIVLCYRGEQFFPGILSHNIKFGCFRLFIQYTCVEFNKSQLSLINALVPYTWYTSYYVQYIQYVLAYNDMRQKYTLFTIACVQILVRCKFAHSHL